MEANDRQVGGTHYSQGDNPQHWDLVTMYRWDYFQGQITKYLMRWRTKNGLQDLEKAAHFLEKYIEEVRAGRIKSSHDGRPMEESRSLAVDPHLLLLAEAKANGLQWEGVSGDGGNLFKCLGSGRVVFAATVLEALAALATTNPPPKV